MALTTAHEGYEYQDLLTTYFVLTELLVNSNTEFFVDRKEFNEDKLDDLTIRNASKKIKRQVKYSNDVVDHCFTKANIASDSSYNLSIDSLYQSWLLQPEKESTEFRICLAWNEPIDELTEYLQRIEDTSSFEEFTTKIFKLVPQKIWPIGQKPDPRWRRFRKVANSIDRKMFVSFCDAVLFELELPKFSLDLNHPGQLERLVIEQSKKLGIGIYPNVHLGYNHFIYEVLAWVKRSRSKGNSFNTWDIIRSLNIKTDYGRIEQKFPILNDENIERVNVIPEFIDKIKANKRSILLGEPGSGKSWFVQNIEKHAADNEIAVVRHYCYTHLDDPLQNDRIKANTFYGNLIHDIISAFPHLEAEKHEKFASNLSELNILLNSIDRPTFIIVDGLDHIERVFNYNKYSDVTREEISIIEKVNRLQIASNVFLVVVSQNVPELSILNDFHFLYIPPWTLHDVQEYLKKRRIADDVIEEDETRSQYIVFKSNGNALYIKYLVDEMEKGNEKLKFLPPYSYNLSLYYAYLLNQLPQNDLIPQVLSGISFSLSEAELSEITGQGNFVARGLKILSPVLKLNAANKGYLLYHESFRRFILENLKKENVSLEKRVFQPIAQWFDGLDFFKHPKPFKFLLPFLIDYGKWDLVLKKLSKDFVKQSIILGHSFKSIENNYNQFVNAACRQQSFEDLVMLNELGKIITAAEDNMPALFAKYIEAFGSVFGFDQISQYLVFEGEPTLDVEHGLLACYICHSRNSSAPWELYMKEFDQTNEISEELFPYYIRGILVLRRNQTLFKVADNVFRNEVDSFKFALRNELLSYQDTEYIQEIVDAHKSLQLLLSSEWKRISIDETEVETLMVQISGFTHVYEDQLEILERFFHSISDHAENSPFISKLSNSLNGKNWFFNWVIYYINVKASAQLKGKKDINLIEIFRLLIRDTEPFKGKPRTSDLYQAGHIIYRSLEEGLKLVDDPSLWKEVIDILIRLSNDTSTYLQRSQGGPLSTSSLFKILRKFSCEANNEIISQVFKNILAEKEEYHLHSDIAEYLFLLATHQGETGDLEDAKLSYQRGVEFALGYTMRKDYTIQDAVKGIEYFYSIDQQEAMKDARRVREMAEAVVSHTDGKGTSHYPVEWFERYSRMNYRSAALFNLHELLEISYNWRAEEGLIQLLIESKSRIDPRVAFYLVMTIPLEDSNGFIGYCLDLMDQLRTRESSLCEKLAVRLIDASKPRDSRKIDFRLLDRLNKVLTDLRFEHQIIIPKAEPSGRSDRRQDFEQIVWRKELDTMSDDEILLYFNTHGAQESDLNSLYYYFYQKENLDDFLKELIIAIIKRNNNDYSNKLIIDQALCVGGEIECFYWVGRFVFDNGGWFERFVNEEAWKKACTIDQDLAFSFLFTLLPGISGAGIKLDYSSNLLKLMAESKNLHESAFKVWKNIMDVTESRLPSIEPLNWELILRDDNSMTYDEIFVCSLLCRFRAGTVERFQWVIAGLEHIKSFDRTLLVKPLIWFFKNKSFFVDAAVVLILQIILEEKGKTENFHKHFEEQLGAMFPTRHFTKDYIISNILNRELPEIVLLPQTILHNEVDNGLRRYLEDWNLRHYMLERLGIDLQEVYNKYSATFNIEYPSLSESYGNRVYNVWVPHVHSSDYINRLINEDCYQNLNECSFGFFLDAFEYAIMFDMKSICINMNTKGMRPLNLAKPHLQRDEYSVGEILSDNDWVRVAHTEEEHLYSGISKKSHISIYSSIVFSSDTQLDYPFADYRLFPDQILGRENFMPKIQHKPIFCLKQDSQIESYCILWPHPEMIRKLNLKVTTGLQGLVAINEANEVLVKVRSWAVNYLGNGYRNTLHDEIPTLSGTELLVHKEVFNSICGQFEASPTYRSLKITHKEIVDEDE